MERALAESLAAALRRECTPESAVQDQMHADKYESRDDVQELHGSNKQATGCIRRRVFPDLDGPSR